MTKAVAYYRVSTAKQGASGLGMDAQRTAVEALCQAKGWALIAPPFQEVESGKRNDRPQLLAAIERCRQTGARLVIAKLDRLSRNAAFLLTLRDSGIQFTAADMPDANEFSVNIMALVAQQEREAISARTKAALQAAKARGKRLGNPNGAAALVRAGRGSAAGVEAAKRKADDHARLLQPVIARLHGEGVTSLNAVARALNAEQMRSPRGGMWTASAVKNLLARLPRAA